MFHGDNARRIDVVKMCENCRVAAVVNEGFDPHTAQRPAPVTTDDYLRAREAQKATRPDRKERTRSRLAATGRSSVERRCVRH
jgi:hypothetical protein